ncbi:MAG: hypothetical protein A2X36_10195 [Elusimicrobia bacterium GWA2_69_24]|nr:MAG: hypothetical protein A2X36_10195 [Elusimicrobia bacterium GWA2_69_24]HBL19208.1 hypothetical protein [Elusimicrobiota bacterium]
MSGLSGVLALALAGPCAYAADVFIGVEGGPSKRAWVVGLDAFLPADPKNQESAEAGRLLRDTLRSDLLFSRYVDLVETIPPANIADAKERDRRWKTGGAALVLQAKASRTADQVVLEAVLRDLASGQAILSRYYRQSAEHQRSLAHRLADDVIKQLTGRMGIAHTRIAFSNDQTGSKELYLADYDGSGVKPVTRNRSINLLPRWHPDGRSLAFTSYKDGNPDLFLFDLNRGSLRTLSDRQGLNLAGGFSPDGNSLAATLSRGKNPNIFLISLKNGAAKEQTSHWGVDSSPTFSPDGNFLSFVSDRSGNPQVYTLELATGRTKRLTNLNWCDTPAWSPSGEWIVFAGRANVKDRIDIFLVDITGTRLVQLTHGEGSNESPSWSPDGRFLTYSSTRDGGRRRIFVMDADGSAPHILADVPGNSFNPSWGP